MDKFYMYDEIKYNQKLKDKYLAIINENIPRFDSDSIIALKGLPKTNIFSTGLLIITNEYFYAIVQLKDEKAKSAHRYTLADIQSVSIEKMGAGAIIKLEYNNTLIQIISSAYNEIILFEDVLRQSIELAIYNNSQIKIEEQQDDDDVNEAVDFESMSMEELQKYKDELERKKLIAELQAMKSQPEQPAQQTTQQSVPSIQRPVVERPMTKKEMIKENKKNSVACCPKCGSTSISASNKKLSIGRAIVGTAILPGVGTVLGGVSSKKTVCVCMNCGHKWKP